MAMPTPALLRAQPGWSSLEFIADVHLHAAEPANVRAWRDYLATTDAAALVILGDLFEVWVGDDALDDAGLEAEACAALAACARGRWVGFMPGNRDFLLGDAACTRTGLHALADPTLLEAFGRRIVLTHGDMLCIGDTEYLAFRREVRCLAWQQDFLARPLAVRRALARAMRARSVEVQRGMAADARASVDDAEVAAWLDAAAADALVHGHTHRPGDHGATHGRTRHVLSDWAADASPPRVEVLRLTRRGFERIRLA